MKIKAHQILSFAFLLLSTTSSLEAMKEFTQENQIKTKTKKKPSFQNCKPEIHFHIKKNLDYFAPEYDSRKSVPTEKMKKFPFNTIGQLRIKDGSSEYLWGTAVLISPNTILTSASNIVKLIMDGYEESVSFYDGWEFYLSSTQANEKEDVRVKAEPTLPFLEEYLKYVERKSDCKKGCDIAIMMLTSPLLNFKKFFEFLSHDEIGFINYSNTKLEMAGYPEYISSFQHKDKNRELLEDGSWCVHLSKENPVLFSDVAYQAPHFLKEENLIMYRMAASSGNNGSPLYIKGNNDTFYLMGIHNYSGVQGIEELEEKYIDYSKKNKEKNIPKEFQIQDTELEELENYFTLQEVTGSLAKKWVQFGTMINNAIYKEIQKHLKFSSSIEKPTQNFLEKSFFCSVFHYKQENYPRACNLYKYIFHKETPCYKSLEEGIKDIDKEFNQSSSITTNIFSNLFQSFKKISSPSIIKKGSEGDNKDFITSSLMLLKTGYQKKMFPFIIEYIENVHKSLLLPIFSETVSVVETSGKAEELKIFFYKSLNDISFLGNLANKYKEKGNIFNALALKVYIEKPKLILEKISSSYKGREILPQNSSIIQPNPSKDIKIILKKEPSKEIPKLTFEQHWPINVQKKLSQDTLNKIKEAYEKKWTFLNLYNSNIDDEGAKCLTQNSFFKELTLGSNKIGNVGAIALAKNSTITILDLSSNNIGDEGVQALAKSRTITTLDLGSNKIIGNKGAQALAQSPTLTELNLSHNNIESEGAQALAQNTTLTTLDLWNNKVGNKGAVALAKNETLTKLNLGYNEIGDEGVKFFAQNTSLTALNIENNKVGDEGANVLIQNTTLSSLDLKYNNISKEIMILIEQKLKKNCEKNK